MTGPRSLLVALVAYCLGGAACSDADVLQCGDGEPVVDGDRSFCVYTQAQADMFGAVPICPVAVSSAVWLGGALVCASEPTTPEALPPAVIDVLRFLSCIDAISPDVQSGADCLIATHLEDDPATRDNEGERNLCMVSAATLPIRIDENRAIADPVGHCGGSIRVLADSGDFGAVTANGDLSFDSYRQITVDAWVFLAPAPADDVASMTGTIAVQADGQYALVVGGGHLAATMGAPCSFDPVASGPPSFWRLAGDPATFPQDAQWHRVTALFDRTTERVELFIDGVLASSSDNTPAMPMPCENRPIPSTSGVEIGFSAFAGPFPGWIDELTIRSGSHLPSGL